MDVWEVVEEERFSTRLERFMKKRPTETDGCLVGLNKYHQTLCDGVKPFQIKAGYIHPEPKGIVAIDQGSGVGLTELRLYAFAFEPTRALHLITMGDKKSQSKDILEAERFVDKLRSEHEQEA
jgi:hypothetical protein